MSQPMTTVSGPLRPPSRSEDGEGGADRARRWPGRAGTRPALPRIPSVPKRERMIRGVYVIGGIDVFGLPGGSRQRASGDRRSDGQRIRRAPRASALQHPQEPHRLLHVVDAEEERVAARGASRPRRRRRRATRGGARRGAFRKASRGRPSARRRRRSGRLRGRGASRPREEGEVLLRRLAEAETRVEEDPVGTDPGDEARGDARGRGRPRRRRRRRGRTATRRTSSPGRPAVVQDDRRVPLGDELEEPVGRVEPRDEVDDVRPRVEGAPGDLGPPRVDGDRDRRVAPRGCPSTTGTTRAISSSTGTSPAPRRRRPRRAAGSTRRRRRGSRPRASANADPAATAAAAVARRPPSENESGVTFRIAITPGGRAESAGRGLPEGERRGASRAASPEPGPGPQGPHRTCPPRLASASLASARNGPRRVTAGRVRRQTGAGTRPEGAPPGPSSIAAGGGAGAVGSPGGGACAFDFVACGTFLPEARSIRA